MKASWFLSNDGLQCAVNMSTPVLGSLLVLSLSSLQKLTYKWIKEREKEMKYDRHTLHFALSTSYSLKKVP